MNGPRNLWEQYKEYRRSREPRKRWERFADWHTAFQILFVVAMLLYAVIASAWER